MPPEITSSPRWQGGEAGTEATMTSPPPQQGGVPMASAAAAASGSERSSHSPEATQPLARACLGLAAPPQGRLPELPWHRAHSRGKRSHEEVACATALGGADRPAGKPPGAWRGRGGSLAPAATSRWPSPAEGVRAETPSQPCRVLLQFRTRPAQALDLSVSQSAVTDHQGSRLV